MAWPDTASIKDSIARRIEGLANQAAGSLLVQAQIDDAYNVANQRIGQYAQMLEQDGTTVPDEWAHWMVALGSYYHATAARFERAKEFREEAEECRVNFALSIQRTAITASTTTHGTPLTLAQVRRSVLSRALRLNPPLMVAVDDVDAAALDAAHDLWTRKDWTWKRRTAKVAVTSESSVAITDKETGTAIVPDRFLSRTMALITTTGAETQIKWMDLDEAPALRARQDTAAEPERFRVDRAAAGTWNWSFWPLPDTVYSYYTSVVIATPALTTPAEFDAATQLMPPRMQTLLRELAYAKVLRSMGHPAGRVMQDVEDRLGRIEAESDDPGAADNNPTVHDVYQDHRFMPHMGLGEGM